MIPIFLIILACSDLGNQHEDLEYVGHEHEGHEHEDLEYVGHEHEGHEHKGHEHEDEHNEHEGDLEDHESHKHEVGHKKEVDEIGIKIGKIAPQNYYTTIKVPGTIQVEFDRTVDVSLPMSVRILQHDVVPHSAVYPGQRLAVVELVDPVIRELQLEALDVRAQLVEGETELKRLKSYLGSLEGSGIDSEISRVTQEVDISNVKIASLEANMEAAFAGLKLLGLGGSQVKALKEKGEVTTTMSLYAPSLKGKPIMEVAARPSFQGQTVQGEALFRLVALDQLLVIGEAFEADLPILREALSNDLPITLLFPAENRMVENLRIRSIEGSLDGRENVVHFFVALPNEIVSEREIQGQKYVDWLNHQGARVQVLIPDQPEGQQFIIPSGAVVSVGKDYFVYRVTKHGYEQVPVVVNELTSRTAVIPLNGSLLEGDEIVFEGALQVHLSKNSGPTSDPHAGHKH